MRKIGMWSMLAFLVLVVGAITIAGRMGNTSHAYARGTVVLPPDLVEAARGVKTLFVTALGDERPMPLGALKHSLDGDPKEGLVYEFVLTPDNVMTMGGAMGGGEWPQTFRLKARLDKDGAGGPDSAGDVIGEVRNVHKGQSGVEVRLSSVVH